MTSFDNNANGERTLINGEHESETRPVNLENATRVVAPGEGAIPPIPASAPMPPITGAPQPAAVPYEAPQPKGKGGDRTNSLGAGIAAGVAAGAALGAGGVVLMSATTPDDPPVEAELPPTEPQGGLHDLVDEHVPYATSVNDSMTFSQAFAAARAEVGAGGCFEWHGQLYGTYYKNEWDNMTAAEKHEYNDHFAWSHGHGAHDHTPDNATAQANTPAARPEPQPEPESDGGDVAFEAIPANGSEVSFFDVDGDGLIDIAGVDVNGDGLITQDEIVDASEYGLTVEDVPSYQARGYSIDEPEPTPEPEPMDDAVMADYDSEPEYIEADIDDITADIDVDDTDLGGINEIDSFDNMDGFEDTFSPNLDDVDDSFDIEGAEDMTDFNDF